MTDKAKQTKSEEEALRALENVCRMGARFAASGMSEMLKATVTPVDLVMRKTDIPNLLSFCGNEDEVVVTIAFAIHGDASGDILAVLPEKTAARCSKRLLAGLDLSDEESQKVRHDCLAELGNVIGSAFLNAVSKVTGLELLPAPPALAEDMAAASCDVLQMRYGSLSDTIMVSEVKFALEDEPLPVQLAILFEPDSWDLILRKVIGEEGED